MVANMETIILPNNEIYEMHIPYADIIKRAQCISDEINSMYANKKIVFIGILNGCLPFMNLLLNSSNCIYNYDFIKISSYNKSNASKLRFELGIKDQIVRNKDIIIIEDIIDSGKTIKYIKKYLNKMNPRSLKVISLLVKNKTIKLSDWYGFKINDKFVIGFGMDFDGTYRNLNNIYIKK